MKRALNIITSISATMILACIVGAQNNPPTWSPSIDYKAGDTVNYLGITFQCTINETTTRYNPHQPSGWSIYYVPSGNVPIPVGPGTACPHLINAWNYIKSARLAAGATITLELQHGFNDSFSSSFSLDHPFGSQISITGDNSGQIASFTSQSPGFTLDSGHSFGGLGGLSIQGPTTGSGGTPAILVSQRSFLKGLSNVSFSNFDVGISADSSQIDNVSEISIKQFVTGGVASNGNGARINIVAPIKVDGADTVSGTPPQYAFLALNGGAIDCPKCIGNDCYYCFDAEETGTIHCQNSSSTSPATTLYGANYWASDKGFIYAVSSSSTGSQSGYACRYDSCIDATSCSAVGYKTYGYFPYYTSTIMAFGSSGYPFNGQDSSVWQ
ncbi:MAG TPA: carbohydrate-binding protein [Fimbriimonadaceae bacterium]|jgi:hypothetical protein